MDGIDYSTRGLDEGHLAAMWFAHVSSQPMILLFPIRARYFTLTAFFILWGRLKKCSVFTNWRDKLYLLTYAWECKPPQAMCQMGWLHRIQFRTFTSFSREAISPLNPANYVKFLHMANIELRRPKN
jgi:hypothetical protein